MAAYHSSLWAQFYDLWVAAHFGEDGPYEDVNVFLSQLQQVAQRASKSDDNTPLAVLEVGAGSGRVIRELYKGLGRDATRTPESQTDRGDERDYILIGTEPSLPMLEKAKTIWTNFQAESIESSTLRSDRIKVFWEHASSSDFADVVSEADLLTEQGEDYDNSRIERPESAQQQGSPSKLNLIIFAAGGVSHLASTEEVKEFLAQISKSLHRSSGRAIISVLHEFFQRKGDSRLCSKLPQEPLTEDEVDEEAQETIQCLPNPTSDGLCFVKYPTREHWDIENKVRIDSFRLTLEDRAGVETASEELNWRMRIVDLDEWKILVGTVGCRLVEVIPGHIQSWIVIQKS